MPRSHVPSGNSPFSPLSVFLPRNQPSPKSSSRSTSSMRSPRLRLSSSGLRATNSSAAGCQHRRRSAPHALRWSQSSSGARWRGGGGTHAPQPAGRPAGSAPCGSAVRRPWPWPWLRRGSRDCEAQRGREAAGRGREECRGGVRQPNLSDCASCSDIVRKRSRYRRRCQKGSFRLYAD
jgi:hypothetical protein